MRIYISRLLLISLLLVGITSIYSFSVTHYLGNIYEYSFGLPLSYWSIYSDSNSRWIFTNLFTGNEMVRINILALAVNIAIFYYLIKFIKFLFKKLRQNN